ncbi:hypothetical protein KM043_015019 [Ampulex compressa]|nr:hypothetical protein KM043_015019 [Ampulex compressa]
MAYGWGNNGSFEAALSSAYYLKKRRHEVASGFTGSDDARFLPALAVPKKGSIKATEVPRFKLETDVQREIPSLDPRISRKMLKIIRDETWRMYKAAQNSREK